MIPYHIDSGTPDNQTLQILIKSKLIKNLTLKKLTFFFSVLKAINEDSPTVPTLLTDYILKGNLLLNFE